LGAPHIKPFTEESRIASAKTFGVNIFNQMGVWLLSHISRYTSTASWAYSIFRPDNDEPETSKSNKIESKRQGKEREDGENEKLHRVLGAV
jgi:hypothetical protein